MYALVRRTQRYFNYENVARHIKSCDNGNHRTSAELTNAVSFVLCLLDCTVVVVDTSRFLFVFDMPLYCTCELITVMHHKYSAVHKVLIRIANFFAVSTNFQFSSAEYLISLIEILDIGTVDQ